MTPEREDPPRGLDVGPAGEDWEVWTPGGGGGEWSLVDLVNRVLDRGVVLTGEVTLSVAGVELVYLGLNAVLTSVATARGALGRPVGRDGAGGG